MEIFEAIAQARDAVLQDRRDGKTTGLVPTMGALHRGHESLIRASVATNDRTYVSIFVNPTQFGDGKDLKRYPRPLVEDLQKCRGWGVDGVFVPDGPIMYPPGSTTSVTPPAVSCHLEGRHRPGHFAGVCTVVLKLFNILPTDNAWFGKKDYQQLAVIRAMVDDLNLPIMIRAGETVRDDDSLAMSSRNMHLAMQQRREALAIPRTLNTVSTRWRSGVRDVEMLEGWMAEQLADLTVHYAVIRDAATLGTPRKKRMAVALIAAVAGQTRLIDNVELHP